MPSPRLFHCPEASNDCLARALADFFAEVHTLIILRFGFSDIAVGRHIVAVPREYEMLAEGIAKKWAEIKVLSVSNCRIGRVACHVLSEVIDDSAPRDGSVQALCDLVGMDHSTVYRAKVRAAAYSVFARLAPGPFSEIAERCTSR